MEWISADERLPEQGKMCIVNIIIPNTKGGRYCENVVMARHLFSGIWTIKNAIVTHWMPMPKVADVEQELKKKKTRLIDADALIEKIKEFSLEQVDIGDYETDNYVEMLRIVESQPPAMAKPIAYAKWEHIREKKETWDKHRGEEIIELPKVRCSLCKETNKQYESPYCPHCGAQMSVEPPKKGEIK